MLNVTPGQAQADCHLLQMPDGSNVLIDAADAADAPGAAVAHLQRLNIHRLSLVIISHFHRDHYGRLIDILNTGITVDRVILNVPDKQSADREIPWGCDWNDVQAVLTECVAVMQTGPLEDPMRLVDDAVRRGRHDARFRANDAQQVRLRLLAHVEAALQVCADRHAGDGLRYRRWDGVSPAVRAALRAY